MKVNLNIVSVYMYESNEYSFYNLGRHHNKTTFEMKIKILLILNKLIGSGINFKDKLTVDWSRIEFQSLISKRGSFPEPAPMAGNLLNLLKYLVAGTGFEPATFGL